MATKPPSRVVTVTVVVPGALAVTNPEPLTEAMAESPEARSDFPFTNSSRQLWEQK